MNTEIHSSTEIQEIRRQHALVVRAVKVSLSLILLLLASACIGAILWIPTASNIIRHTFPGSAVPLATQFVLGHSNWLALSAMLFAIVGLAVLLAARLGKAIAVATVVSVLLFAQWQFMVLALQLPFAHLSHALTK